MDTQVPAFQYVTPAEYCREQYNLEERISVANLKESQIVKVYGMLPDPGYLHENENALKFTAKLELYDPEQRLRKDLLSTVARLLVYSGEITPEATPAYDWPTRVYPDLRPNSPRINGSPLAEWAFPSDEPVVFSNGLYLRLGFFSRRDLSSGLDSASLSDIERFANREQ